MISRRQIIVGAGSTSVAAGMGCTVNFLAGAPARTDDSALSLFLYDRSIAGASSAASIAKHAGVNVEAFHEDVGVPWLDVIEPMWRQRPRSIAGITHSGALFCLAHLSRSPRMACTFLAAASSPTANAFEAVVVRLLQAAANKGASLSNFDEARGPVAWLLQPVARNNQ